MERFGPYELEEKLGEGGMAEVFRARRRGAEGFVRALCVKRLLPAIEADAALAEAFGDEARILAALHHPAIVSVLDFGRHGGRSFLAMELVEGTDLRRLLRRTGPLSPELALYVGHELASALAHAHAAVLDGVAQQVVHRDVTPSNVLVSVDGAVKLADFGIARATTRTQVTQHGIVKGKIPYMAPEQALGDELDQRADLFALGVVLFECLAGRRPYDGASDLETFRNVQRGLHAPLDALAPGTPPDLVELVHALLRPLREHRIASADEVVELLSASGVQLGARRALVERVERARLRGGGPRAAVRAALGPAREASPAARATRAERPPRATLTERMSPTGLVACFGDEATEPEPAPRGAATARIRISLSRLQLVVLALVWIAVASALGGLLASLVPADALATYVPSR